MSQENVEIVRRVYEAAARRDPATVLALYDPDVELDPSRLQAVGVGLSSIGSVYHGHDGLRSFSASGMRRGRAWSTTTTN